jgi:WhiB family redox-sensing transcriptional regulator
MSNAYTTWEKFWEGAACAGSDTNLFFDPDDDRLTKRERTYRENAAKRICASCPIKPRCMNYAITHNQQGVWGGLTEKERIQRQKVAKQFLSSKSRSKLYL